MFELDSAIGKVTILAGRVARGSLRSFATWRPALHAGEAGRTELKHQPQARLIAAGKT